MNYTFAVVTRVPDNDQAGGLAGNLALAMPLYVETGPGDHSTGYTPQVVPATEVLGPVVIGLRAQVFVKGEILVLGPDGREVAGHGRKPSKWDVDVETVDTIEEAIALAQQVLV